MRIDPALLDAVSAPPVVTPPPVTQVPLPISTGDLTLANGTVLSGTGTVIPPGSTTVQTPTGVVPKGALDPALIDAISAPPVVTTPPPAVTTPAPVQTTPVTPTTGSTTGPTVPHGALTPGQLLDIPVAPSVPQTPMTPPTPVTPATPTPISTPVTPTPVTPTVPHGALPPGQLADIPVAPSILPPPPNPVTPPTGAPNGAGAPPVDTPVAPSVLPPPTGPVTTPGFTVDPTIPHGAVIVDGAGNIIGGAPGSSAQPGFISGGAGGSASGTGGPTGTGGPGSGTGTGGGGAGGTGGTGTGSGTTPTTTKVAFNVFRDVLTSLVGFDPVNDAQMIQELYNAADQYIASGIDYAMIPSILAGSADLGNVAPAYKAYLGDYNTIRGLNVNVTSVADFIQARNAYKSLFTQYGMPDLATNANADKFLMNQVSAAEAASRLNTAYNAVLNADAALKQQLSTYYPSLQPKDIVATMLGVGKTVDQLQKEINIAGIKAESTTAGVTPTLSAEELAAQGVTRQAARQGYQQTAQEIAPYTAAAERAGVSTTDLQKELESENLLGLASQRRKRIQSAEQNLFTGSSGTGAMSLSRQGSAGNF